MKQINLLVKVIIRCGTKCIIKPFLKPKVSDKTFEVIFSRKFSIGKRWYGNIVLVYNSNTLFCSKFIKLLMISNMLSLIRWHNYNDRQNTARYHNTFESLTMMTSSNGNISRVTGPLCGEFTGPGEFPTQRPVTRSFVVFFDLRLNKPLSKQPWGWWFETPSWSLWRHCSASLWLLAKQFRTHYNSASLPV